MESEEGYDLDFVEEDLYKRHVKSFFLYPKFWAEGEAELAISLSWKNIRFTKDNYSEIPPSKGVYAFVVMPEFKHLFETRYLFYIGKTNRTLKQRFKEYLGDSAGKGKPRPKIFKMMKMYKEYLHFFYVELVDAAVVDNVEECLLNTLVPKVNTRIPKAKIKPELRGIYELN